MPRFLISLLLAAALLPVEARGQHAPFFRPAAQTIDLSGPRVGVTVLSAAVRELAGHRGRDIGPVISQFGWQIERRFLTGATGATGVTEFVGLIGGVEQGLVLPSLSWLVGFRTERGLEFAAGPNLGVSGAALALAAGVTLQAGSLNLPVNLAVVPSRVGTRVSVLAGFNLRRP